MAQPMENKAGSTAEQTKPQGQNLADQAKQAADKVKDKAAGLADKAKDVASNVTEKAKETASHLGEQAQDYATVAGQKAREAASSVKESAEQGMHSVASGMKNLAGSLRERGPGDGLLGNAASTVADGLERSGAYIDETGLNGMVEDLGTLIRRNPVPAVLVGIGIGFMLGRMMRSGS